MLTDRQPAMRFSVNGAWRVPQLSAKYIFLISASVANLQARQNPAGQGPGVAGTTAEERQPSGSLLEKAKCRMLPSTTQLRPLPICQTLLLLQLHSFSSTMNGLRQSLVKKLISAEEQAHQGSTGERAR